MKLNTRPFTLMTILFLLISYSCSGPKMILDPAQASPKVVLSKGACFGDCPVYTLTIYNTGLMKYNGVRNTEKEGKFEKQLQEQEYVELIRFIEKRNIWKLEDTYQMDIADLPPLSFSYSDKDQTKTIKGKADLPLKLVEIEKYLDSLIQTEGWIQTEGAVEKPWEETAIIDDEIIIKGSGQLILVRWLKKYKEYGLRIGKRLGPESEYWLVRFDKSLIEPAKMLEMIKNDPAIEEAEFNKKIVERDR